MYILPGTGPPKKATLGRNVQAGTEKLDLDLPAGNLMADPWPFCCAPGRCADRQSEQNQQNTV